MNKRSSAADLEAPPREPSPSGIVNRRSSPRLSIEVEVTLASESQFFTGLSGDISEGGLFIATYRALAVGARVPIELALPDGDVSVVGEVRWTRAAGDGAPPGVGVGFVDLSAEARERIERFCRARAPLYVDVDE